jgi:DNA-binding response OmpR family regulator
MLPATLALIDDDAEFGDYLAQDLRRRGITVDVFRDSNDALSTELEQEFFIVDLMLPGVDGVQLVDILRRRSDAGILVVSGRLGPDVFASVMKAGADMHLAKPVQFDQVVLAVEAVFRRSAASGRANPAVPGWRLHRAARELQAPDGARISLSEADLAVMECFIEAAGDVVTRDVLRARVGHTESGVADDSLNAVIYRLRRRIERATPHLVPLQSRSRVGYVFRAPLNAE